MPVNEDDTAGYHEYAAQNPMDVDADLPIAPTKSSAVDHERQQWDDSPPRS